MGTALSSWKEIAHYVGKGVRTVQRWEREAGLPVRRPQGEGKGKVLAFPGEIDGWMHSAFTRNGDEGESELSLLRARVEQLIAENQELRRDLNASSPETIDVSACGAIASSYFRLASHCNTPLSSAIRWSE